MKLLSGEVASVLPCTRVMVAVLPLVGEPVRLAITGVVGGIWSANARVAQLFCPPPTVENCALEERPAGAADTV